MANWTGAARTNYVRLAHGVTVRNLRQRFASLGIQVGIWDDKKDKAGKQLVAFYPDDGDDGGFSSMFMPEDTRRNRNLLGYPSKRDDKEQSFPEDVDFDWALHVMPFIREDEVQVVMEAGHEKLRYISGHATAYVRRANGEVASVCVSLGQIYALAKQEFGLPEDREISEAQY